MAERSKAPDSRDRPFSNQSILVLEWGRRFESHFWQKLFLYCFSKVYQILKFGMKYTCYIYISKKSVKVMKNYVWMSFCTLNSIGLVLKLILLTSFFTSQRIYSYICANKKLKEKNSRKLTICKTCKNLM